MREAILMHSPSRPASRWLAIDQTRGAAMVLVWISHFGAVYFRGAPALAPARAIAIATRVASPTFVTVSGMLLGWLASGDRRGRLGPRFVDRALILLLVAHPVIWAAHIAWAHGPGAALRTEFITDTLAACLLVAPLVVARVGRIARLAASVVGFVGCWVVIARYDAAAPSALRELLVGALEPRVLEYVFPVLPWLSVFIAATALGEALERLHRERLGDAARLAWWTSGVLASVAIAGAAVHRAVAPRTVLWAMTMLGQKSPPGPVYVAAYGAAGLALFAAFVELERRRRDSAFGRVLALVGRNSLFAFGAQYFVYYTALALLHPAISRAWMLWLPVSIVVLLGAVAAWDAIGGNRWLTFGVGALPPVPVEAAGVAGPDDLAAPQRPPDLAGAPGRVGPVEEVDA
jgi:uncharacterized membrane protein